MDGPFSALIVPFLSLEFDAVNGSLLLETLSGQVKFGRSNPTEDGAQVLGLASVEFREDLGLEVWKIFSLWKALSWLLFALRPESSLGRAERGTLSAQAGKVGKVRGSSQAWGQVGSQVQTRRKEVHIGYQHPRGQEQGGH